MRNTRESRDPRRRNDPRRRRPLHECWARRARHRSSTDQRRAIRVTRHTSARLSSRRSRGFDPLDFLAEVSAHIPDAHAKTTRFSGWYAHRTRGDRKRHGPRTNAEAADPAAAAEGTRAPLEGRRSWARVLRQGYAVDPLLGPRGGGPMKGIAVIEPACADLLARGAQASTADRRPAVACLPAGRSGRCSPTGASPPRPPASARHPTSPPRAWSYAPLG